MRKNRKGQAVVELSLVLPIFLLVVIPSLIDFPLFLSKYLTRREEYTYLPFK